MMNYELFKEIVAEQILSYMPEDFKDYKVEIHPVNKVNMTLDGMNLIPPGMERYTLYPTIYVDHIYEEYLIKDDLREVLELTAFNLAAHYRSMPKDFGSFHFENDKSKIVMLLINTEQNKEMLQDVPHREFQDLSIVYKYVTDMNRDGMASALVSNSLAEMMGMNEQELYEAAAINTKKLFPPVVKNMNEIMHDLFVEQGMPEEMISMFIGALPDDRAMYVITNDMKLNGAVSMLYENELHDLAEKLQSDLYIMPSSLHEVIAVSANAGDPNMLAQMVAEVNMGEVCLDERLSNQVYHYDKDLRKLSLATDTPNKRLDGFVSEPPLIYESKQPSK